MKSVWWHSATNEQRLVQVNAAYELELTIDQMATNFQVSRETIRLFLRKNEINWKKMQHLPRTLNRQSGSMKALETHTREQNIQKYQKIDNTALDEAFTLFENNGRNFEMNYLENYH